MKKITTAVTLIAFLCASCDRSQNPQPTEGLQSTNETDEKVSSDQLLHLQVPALSSKGRKLIDVLHDLNRHVSSAIDGDTRGEIVIVRHHPKIDNGEKVLEMDLPASTLGEQLTTLGVLTFTHWTISENGYLIFRTWHRPQYDFDDYDGLDASD